MNYSNAKRAHLRLGKWGEKIACKYLRYNDYEIVLENYRNKHGEIDIIAKNEDIICFIEVKTRRSSTKARPSSGLKQHQRDRIKRASKRYLTNIDNPKIPFRYDLIEIIKGRWDICEFRYWESNF